MAKKNQIVDETATADFEHPVDAQSEGFGEQHAEPAKPIESKFDRFRRLGQMRVPKAVKAIRNIANLANRSQYQYSEDQADKIVKALTEAVQQVRNAFSGKTAIEESFRL